MNLTPHQQDTMVQVVEALETHNRVVLQGSAGTGKTFLVNKLMEYIGVNQRDSVYLTAPTNKALAVLRSKTTTEGNIIFSTVHSALKLKRRWNKKGEVFFKQEYSEKYPPFENCRMAIIDEASMLNEEILEYLEQYSFPILFIGDEKQLNPVGEEHSPVFHKHWRTFTLTEIVRQGKDNPIIELSRDIKRIWSRQERLNELSGYLYSNDREKVIEKLAKVNGTDELKYLAWTNAEVDIMNYAVRHAIYKDPAMIEEGEALIFNAPYGESFYTNQEIKVEDLEIDELDNLKIYVVNSTIRVIHEDSLKTFKQIVKDIKADGKNVFVIELDSGNADFPFIMTDYHLPVMPATDDGSMNWQDHVGCGAYKIENHQPGIQTALSRH